MTALHPADLLQPRREGLYCPVGDFHIDPVLPVARALITHAHSDHARAGHGAVLATARTLTIMQLRLGDDFCGTQQVARFGERIDIGGVAVSFHPAGHIFGSAQIRLDHKGLVIVASGDYKRAPDPTAEAFELVPCHVFITEATFGLPVFRHPPALDETRKLLASLAARSDRWHLVGAYALGKAQRLIALLRQAGYDAPIHLHGATERVCRLYEEAGIDLGPLVPATEVGARRATGTPGIVICPPSALGDRWSARFGDAVHAMASGWMRVKARARQRGVELPLIISDHADWPDLQRTLLETGATDIWVTHGQEDALVHWATGQGLAARPLHLVGFGDEADNDLAEAT